jgi:hypothetical protein
MKTKLFYLLAVLLVLLTALFFLNYTDTTRTQRHKLLQENWIITPNYSDTLQFCNEKILLSDFDLKERYEKELIQAIYQHSTTLLLIKQSKRWKQIILPILKSEHIPEDFFYLMVTESHFRLQATSNKGAQGLWQLMKETAEYYRLEVNALVDERNDPVKSTYAACKFLKDAYQKLGDWKLVAAAYNRGLNGLLLDMSAQKVQKFEDIYLNPETSRYLFRIIALKNIMENPQDYGYKLFPSDYYDTIPYRTLTIEQTIPDIVEFAKKQGTNYKNIKLLNPWIIGNSLPVSNGKKYEIKIPLK